MGKTSIEWCRNDDGTPGQSWPLVNGCRRTSPGCQKCYAERLASTRLSKTPKYGGLAVFGQNGPRWTGETRFWDKDLTMPLRLRKHSRIFVADMGDLFYEAVPEHVIDRVLAVMVVCAMRDHGPAHVFQVLSKRAARMRALLDVPIEEIRKRLATPVAQLMEDGDGWWDTVRDRMPWPLPNVHLGVSCESQEYADDRILHLLATPAAVRFVSAEPLLGPIDFSYYLGSAPRLDQVIFGSESGPGAREMDVAWARTIVNQCVAAGVPVFTKQIATERGRAMGHPKGGNPLYWPPGNWPRQFPEVRP